MMTTKHEEEYGVLLYYKYATIPDLHHLHSFYDSNCHSLSLVGRVRISPTGVNVTVGGKLSALKKHIDDVSSNSLFEGTDFKLASCSEPDSNTRVANECGFTTLSIRIVKELVTFSSFPLLKSPEISNAGKHLSASEFHSVLQNAGNFGETGKVGYPKKVMLLDARNMYETRIGKFQNPMVETLDPEIRQYSDLPSWIDDNSHKLEGSCVLMYCTGGIRCEMASSYIKSKGVGFENVFQLYGGIQRYLEQFPDGGFFRGKNFVFDHRVSVGSSNASILGTCLLCDLPYDDYSPRCRCTHCRMLVLVCNNCQVYEMEKNTTYVCELCKKTGNDVPLLPLIGSGEIEQEISIGTEPEAVTTSNRTECLPQLTRVEEITMPSRKLRILCLHGFRQNASSFKGRTASLAKKLKHFAEFIFIDAPHKLPFIYQPSLSQQIQPPPSNSCNSKFAWFVNPDFISESDNRDWNMSGCPFDPLQFMQQTEGFDTSLAHLKNLIAQTGPFDGLLGFSQGAAMTASVSALRGQLKGEIDFRFVILCSGFAINLSDQDLGSIDCPSLHIFGSEVGKDRQIACEASRELVSLFDPGSAVIIEHEFGHIIPPRSPYLDKIKDFLKRFL
ncbi:rhodanese-like domain-containing protein 6 [Impatiens glandulifera]|uniref:rhodanese-like domain-containing protein 6 n=1 Tax=Impatiens glandulifera TaxID=253017 RepID=UPI001FB0FD31|nr:rhodanese-like domain-containing protein 6 [Impatiens glandulifera]